MRVLENFSKAEVEECNQEDWSVSDKFGINTPCSAIYFLEEGACVSLKVAIKGSVRGKSTLKI